MQAFYAMATLAALCIVCITILAGFGTEPPAVLSDSLLLIVAVTTGGGAVASSPDVAVRLRRLWSDPKP